MSFRRKVLLIEWNSYCHEDMKSALKEAGYFVQGIPFPNGIRTEKAEAEKLLTGELKRGFYDFVFSFNYFPVISEICQQAGAKYLSWVYDSPYIHDIMTQLQKAYPTDPNALTVMSPEAIYADFVFNRQVTALERQEILKLLGKRYEVHLYTNEYRVQIPGVKNHGPVEYYREMPVVFQNSKISLNITLRSIKTGIPLRALDIMGSGGFLLTNYQTELSEFFEPDVDFVYYSDYEDLQEKADYYLTHEKEREEIAANGCQKVRREHIYNKRIKEMERTVGFFS